LRATPGLGLAAGARAKVVQASREERAAGPWTGGSILASLGTFPDLWFSREEYREHGARGFARKII
jgi:actin-like protein 6A